MQAEAALLLAPACWSAHATGQAGAPDDTCNAAEIAPRAHKAARTPGSVTVLTVSAPTPADPGSSHEGDELQSR